jgi:hypothetical protein
MLSVTKASYRYRCVMFNTSIRDPLRVQSNHNIWYWKKMQYAAFRELSEITLFIKMTTDNNRETIFVSSTYLQPSHVHS